MDFRVIQAEERGKDVFCRVQVFLDKSNDADEREIFEDVPWKIKKYNKCKKKCKYYMQCEPLRRFDCKKKLKFIQHMYVFLTGIIFGLSTIFVFFVYNQTFLKGLGFMLLLFVVIDVICCLIEKIIPYLRNKLFYRKLVKMKKKREKIKQKEEETEKADEFQKILESTFSGNIVLAEDFVKKLRKVSDEKDFGINDKKIDECVNKLEEIIEILKKDNSNYPRVAFLFEVYLPKIYDILMQYIAFMEAGCEAEKVRNILSDFIEKFLEYLKTQKIESRLGKDENQAIIEFQSLAETVQSNF